MKIDFDEVSRMVPLQDVPAYLGFEVVESHSGQFRGQCPVCDKGGDGRSLVVTPEKGWICFRSKHADPKKQGAGKTSVGLAAHLLNLDFKQAATHLVEAVSTAQAALQQGKAESAPPKEEKKGFDPDEYAKTLDADHPAVAALGISAEDARKLSIGYCSKGMHKGLTVFPVRNTDGSIAGFIGIESAKVPKQWRYT